MFLHWVDVIEALTLIEIYWELFTFLILHFIFTGYPWFHSQWTTLSFPQLVSEQESLSIIQLDEFIFFSSSFSFIFIDFLLDLLCICKLFALWSRNLCSKNYSDLNSLYYSLFDLLLIFSKIMAKYDPHSVNLASSIVYNSRFPTLFYRWLWGLGM